MAIDDNTSYELTGYQVKDLANKVRGKADTASLASVATSGLYSDLTGTPTIPTVNNGTLTIKQNGTTIDTFTANQSTNVTVDLAGGIYADDPTSPATPAPWVTGNDIDWSTFSHPEFTFGTSTAVSVSNSANVKGWKIHFCADVTSVSSAGGIDVSNSSSVLDVRTVSSVGSSFGGELFSGTTTIANLRGVDTNFGGMVEWEMTALKKSSTEIAFFCQTTIIGSSNGATFLNNGTITLSQADASFTLTQKKGTATFSNQKWVVEAIY